MLGFDVLEMRDHLGNKYSVMSMVEMATCFHHVRKLSRKGGGQPTSEACAKALMTKVDCLGWLAKSMHHGSRPSQPRRSDQDASQSWLQYRICPFGNPSSNRKGRTSWGYPESNGQKSGLLILKQQDLQTLRCCCKNAHPRKTACREQMVTVQANGF